MAVINKDIAYMALPLSIRRGNPFPIDEYSVWYDKAQMQTYATSNPVAYVGQILTLVDEAQSTVEAYMIQNASGTLIKLASTTASGDLTQDVQVLQGKVSTIQTTLGTKAEESGISATNVWAALEEIKQAYEAADTAINGQFANYYNKSETDDKIAVALSSAYKAAGSIAFESLPSASATEEGKVYNISNEFTTTENFVEGAGSKHPAGTNVVCVETADSQYKWDVLAGFVDLSGFYTSSTVDEKLAAKVDKVVGSSLVEDTLISKLRNMLEIKSLDENEFTLDDGTKEVSIKQIPTSKITNLDATLLQKVNVEAGKSLVEDTLITKLSGLKDIKSLEETELALSPEGKLSIVAIEQSKVTGLPEALEATIKGINVGGTSIEAEEGVVSIPIGSADAFGVVKSSEQENNIKINGDGTMSVNTVNIDKLVQTAGSELILNGGNASSNA